MTNKKLIQPNDTKKQDTVKEKKPKPTLNLEKARKEIDEKQKNLIAKIEKLGYMLPDFLTLTPDPSDGHAEASTIDALQKEYQAIIKQKKRLEKTIIVEPAKLHETIDAIEELLQNNNDYPIYQRGGKLVCVSTVATAPQEENSIKQPNGTPVIKEIDQAFLTVYLTKIGHFITLNSQGNIKNIDCPERIARYVLAKQEWAVPVLTGIINAPILRKNGSVLDEPGYDTQSGILFIPSNYTFNPIPEKLSLEDAQRAVASLSWLLDGFPFEGEVSRSVALAAILTALIRKSISTAPLFGFTAPKMASGKSLLADVVSLIATGKCNSVISQADSEAEEKKRLFGILLEGCPVACFDNIEKPFGSAALCSVLTQTEYKDRILGVNESKSVPTNITFLATGNNLTFTGDISTRVLLCKIDPKVERPEERSFNIDLRTYIPENRAKIVADCLTILRAYRVAGSPKQDIKPFGRFEEWSNWVRSALVWVRLADPCESRKEIEKNDPIRLLLGSLFYAWHEIFGEEGIKIKHAITAALHNAEQEMHEMLKETMMELAADRRGEINPRTLARKLTSFKGRIENGYRLEQAGTNQGTTLWRVKKIDA
jgi:hypothetical protein